MKRRIQTVRNRGNCLLESGVRYIHGSVFMLLFSWRDFMFNEKGAQHMSWFMGENATRNLVLLVLQCSLNTFPRHQQSLYVYTCTTYCVSYITASGFRASVAVVFLLCPESRMLDRPSVQDRAEFCELAMWLGVGLQRARGRTVETRVSVKGHAPHTTCRG